MSSAGSRSAVFTPLEPASLRPAREVPAPLASTAVVARIGALPYEAVEALKLPGAARLVSSILDHEERMLERRAALSDGLGAQVPLMADDEVRQSVIRVRRSLYNLRSPNAGDLTAVAQLPPELASAAGAFAADIAEYRSGLDRLPGLLADESAASRLRLRHWAGGEDFMSALVVATPDLYRDVRRHLADELKGHKMKPVEAALVRYLVRAATKTSPFGRFTAIGRGEWREEGPVLSCGPLDAADNRESHVQLSVGWLSALERFVILKPEIREMAPVRVNAALWSSEGRLWWVKRRASNRSLNVIQNSEAVVAMTPVPTVDRVIAHLQTSSGVSYRELREFVRELSAPPSSDAEAEAVVQKLIELGIVAVGFPIPAGVRDPWAHFDSYFDAEVCEEAAEVKGVLARMRGIGSEFRQARATERECLLEEVGGLRRRCMQLVSPELSAQGGEIGKRQFLHEDMGLRERLNLDPYAWRERLDELALATNLFLLHDPVLVNQFDMAEEYRRAYGEGRVLSFWQFFNAFHMPRTRRLAARGDTSVLNGLPSLVPHPNELQCPEISVVNELRGELGAMVEAFSRSGEGPLLLDRDVLRSWGRRFPNPYREFLRVSLFCMFGKGALDGGDRPAGVVNACSLGYGKFMSRFCWMMDSIHLAAGGGAEGTLSSTLRHASRRGCPDDTVLGEFGGHFGAYDVESHPPLTAFEIEYPGEPSVRPASEVIRMGDLDVGYNPHTRLLELRSRVLQKKVWPLHLGFLSTSHTPPLFRCLKEFSVPMSAPVGRPSLWREERRGDLTFTHSPRVQVGRMVVAREEWAVPTGALPFALGPIEFWLDLQRLRRRIGLPAAVFRSSNLFARFFIQGQQELARRAGEMEAQAAAKNAGAPAVPVAYPVPAPLLDDGRPVQAAVAYRDDARKPMFLDFDNYHLVTAFQKTGALQGTHVLFSEALPAPDDLLFASGPKSFVSELVLELSGTAV